MRGSLFEGMYDGIGDCPQLFIIAPVDKYRSAARGSTAVDIPPAISHHEGTGQINPKKLRCVQEHPRCRLTTGTHRAAARMSTHFDVVDGKLPAHEFVHGVDGFARLGAAADIRLIRCHHEEKARGFQPIASLHHPWQKAEFRERRRRVRLAFPHHRFVDHSVAIQENGAFSFLGHSQRTLSHFVAFTFSAG